MQYLYPFFISFILIFFSELGDKTQILVLSFSTRNKSTNILLGVALGTLFSHGLAIAFGSHIGFIQHPLFIHHLKIFTYCTFLLFGITGFLKIKKFVSDETNSKSKIINFFSSLIKNCVLIVAISIAIGELGDKTFLASIGLGIQYPLCKTPLILGAICGMVLSNSLAIFFGKFLGAKISPSSIDVFSNIIFILFGLIGFLSLIL